MKRLLKLVAVLVILLVIGVVAAFFFIDRLAKTAVERGSTYALGVETTLESADVRIFKGEFDMGALHVSNPEGFKTPHFLTLDDGGVAVTLGSLREEIIELPTLHLTGIDINLEKQAGKSNYKVILENLKRLSEGKPADAESKTRYIVREVSMRDINVHVDVLPIGGEATRLHLDIPEITLTDVGSDTGKGVLMSELSGIIVKALFAAILQKGGDLLPGDLTGELGNALAAVGDLGSFGAKVADELLHGVGEGLGGLIEGAGGIGEGAGKAIDEGLKGIGQGLGGLLGGQKENNEDDE